MNIVKSIISAFPWENRIPKEGPFLDISEFFYDTIQGEGIYMGHPAAFLRLQGCTLNCLWCDTKEVWRTGNRYALTEIFDLIDSTVLVSRLKRGDHLVITGGSPLKQQDGIVAFLDMFEERYKFFPFVEIENECIIRPSEYLIEKVSCWNNSPKLHSSGMTTKARFNVLTLGAMADLPNSWFKFVICDPEKDWNEIQSWFIEPGYITPSQIILMPEGATRIGLTLNSDSVANLAIEKGVRFSNREHVVLWDRTIGI